MTIFTLMSRDLSASVSTVASSETLTNCSLSLREARATVVVGWFLNYTPDNGHCQKFHI